MISETITHKTCLYCDRPFSVRNDSSHRRYCSDACSRSAKRSRESALPRGFYQADYLKSCPQISSEVAATLAVGESLTPDQELQADRDIARAMSYIREAKGCPVPD